MDWMLRSSYDDRITGVVSRNTLPQAPGQIGKSNGKPVTYTRKMTFYGILSTAGIATICVVVTVIENRTRNDANESYENFVQ